MGHVNESKGNSRHTIKLMEPGLQKTWLPLIKHASTLSVHQPFRLWNYKRKSSSQLSDDSVCCVSLWLHSATHWSFYVLQAEHWRQIHLSVICTNLKTRCENKHSFIHKPFIPQTATIFKTNYIILCTSHSKHWGTTRTKWGEELSAKQFKQLQRAQLTNRQEVVI